MFEFILKNFSCLQWDFIKWCFLFIFEYLRGARMHRHDPRPYSTSGKPCRRFRSSAISFLAPKPHGLARTPITYTSSKTLMEHSRNVSKQFQTTENNVDGG